jgi:hypothetical protein
MIWSRSSSSSTPTARRSRCSVLHPMAVSRKSPEVTTATRTPVPRLRAYDGPVLLSYGFRPFFLVGSTYAGLAVLVWLPVFYGELSLHSVFAPRDWHVHAMLYGYLPAVITGYLFTAIPNWTGHFPIQGKPLLALVLVWIAGRVVVMISADVGWLPAAAIDVGFLSLIVAAAAREILAGKNWRNLKVVVLVALLLAGNAAFHLEAHFNGTADYGVRVGIAVVVLLIALIGGRIIPSFTRNWLARENPGRLPSPFGPLDMAIKRSGVVGLGFRPGRPARRDRTWFRRAAEYRATRALGRGPNVGRSTGSYSARRLLLRAAGFPAGRCGCLRPPSGQRGYPRMDGRRCGHHDARGDDPREPRPHRSAHCGVVADAGDLCRRRRGRSRPHLCCRRAIPSRCASPSRRGRLGRSLSRVRCRVRSGAAPQIEAYPCRVGTSLHGQ